MMLKLLLNDNVWIAASALVMLLFVCAVILLVRTIVAEEYKMLLGHVEHTYDREWAMANLHTGDVIISFAPRHEGGNFFQSHACTHTAVVLELDPSAAFEHKLVFEVRKRCRDERDLGFLTLRSFFKLYATQGVSFLVRRLAQPLDADSFAQKLIWFRSCVFRDIVSVEQINTWVERVPFLPFLPQPSVTPNAMYCSLATVVALVSAGVLHPDVLSDPQRILTPSELAIPPELSQLRHPLSTHVMSPHRWLPLVHVVQKETLEIQRAERNGDLIRAYLLSKSREDDRVQRKGHARREHRDRRKLQRRAQHYQQKLEEVRKLMLPLEL